MKSDDYWQSIEDFCDLCEDNLGDNFVSFIIIGSIGASDLVPGWSDVDSYLVLKEKMPDSEKKIKSMIEEITQKYPYYQTDRGSWFTVMVETKDFFLNPDAEFLTLWDVKDYSKIARGEDFRNGLQNPEPDRSWPDKNTNWMLDFLKNEQDASSFWKIKNSIGFILCGARNVLLKNDLYYKKYDEILTEFAKLYPERMEIVKEASQYRNNWLNIKETDIDHEKLYEEALIFLEWCVGLTV